MFARAHNSRQSQPFAAASDRVWSVIALLIRHDVAVETEGDAEVEIRPATPDDAAATAAIYNEEVTGSTVTFDLVTRTPEEQAEWLGARSGALEVIVAEINGEVAGFASISSFRDRPAYRTTVEDSVYVHRDQRGRGVGRALLAEILRVAEARGFHCVMARIVGDHEASIRLHRAVGFEHVGVEREVGRKFGRWLNVAVMQKLL